MNNFNRLMIISSALMATNVSYAMSKRFRGGDVDIIIKSSSPCFYVGDDRSKFSKNDRLSINVSDNENVTKWNVYEPWSSPPTSIDKCISYGQTTKIKSTPAQKLQLNKRYTAVLELDKTYGVDFCLRHDQNEKVIVTKYDGKQCTMKPLVRHGFWYTLFFGSD